MTINTARVRHVSSHDTLNCAKVWKLSEIFKALQSKDKLSLSQNTRKYTTLILWEIKDSEQGRVKEK